MGLEDVSAISDPFDESFIINFQQVVVLFDPVIDNFVVMTFSMAG